MFSSVKIGQTGKMNNQWCYCICTGRMSLISETTWKFLLCTQVPHLCLLPALFPLWTECNQLWHEKTRSLSVRTLLVFRWQSSADSPPPLSPPKWPLSHLLVSPLTPPHIRCAYEHQNAIRASKTPLVPRLARPRTVVVHSELWALTTGPLLQSLWKINPKKSHSRGKILGSERQIEQLGKISPGKIQ